jgi:hypothetical protein
MIRSICFFIFLLITNSANAQPVTPPPAQSEWYESALRFIPDAYVGGSGYSHGTDPSDAKSLSGYIAVYPKAADDPKTPASAFDAGYVLVVKLGRQDGKLTALTAELRPRNSKPGYDIPRELTAVHDEADYDALNAELLAKAKSLPAGTMPCEIRAWSEDKDPKGLNVRAEPGVKTKIFGTLPPPYNFKKSNAPDSGWQTEFTIIGFWEGWFLIEGARPPGQAYEAENYPRNHPKPYPGRGWVAANKVGAQFANGNTRMGGLYQAPHTDAKWTPALNESGSEISADGGPKSILACSGFWALVESHNGVRGWWRRLCSNQVTNCS